MDITQKDYKTVKINSADYRRLCHLQLYFLINKRLTINKKRLLGWALRKALEDLKKYEN